MKRISLVVALCTILVSVSAQNFYIKFDAGYGVGVKPSHMSTSSFHYHENEDTSSTSYYYQLNNLAIGSGLKAGGAMGWKLSEHLNFEIGLGYSRGKSREYTFLDQYTYDYWIDAYVNLTSVYSYRSTLYQLRPALLIRASDRKWTPYFGLGLVAGLASMEENYNLKIINTVPGYYPTESIEQVTTFKRRLSLGYALSGGLEWSISKNAWVFFEGRYTDISYSPSEAEVTAYKYRGEDELNNLTDSERYIEFVDAYSDTEVGEYVPSKQLKKYFSLSHVAVMAGIKVMIKSKRAGGDS